MCHRGRWCKEDHFISKISKMREKEDSFRLRSKMIEKKTPLRGKRYETDNTGFAC